MKFEYGTLRLTQELFSDETSDSVDEMKYKTAEILYKMDQLKSEIEKEIKDTSLPQNEIDSIMKDFDYDSENRKKQLIGAFAIEIMQVQNTLSSSESIEEIGTDIAKYYAEIKNEDSRSQSSSNGGGCLIATATFDSELSPQVQKLREIRDSKLLQTESGTQFMESFNSFYYSFSQKEILNFFCQRQTNVKLTSN